MIITFRIGSTRQLVGCLKNKTKPVDTYVRALISTRLGEQRLQPIDTGVADVNTDSTQQTVIWECRVATIVVAIAIL